MKPAGPAASFGPSNGRPPLGASLGVSIVLPTYNEAENVREAIRRVQSALAGGSDYEIVVVDDDSPDRTWRIVDDLHRQDNRIRCLRRVGRHGLASAIVEGLESAREGLLVVMDADLQHDATKIPALLAALENADVAVASRYVEGGSTQGWKRSRRWISRLATKLGQRTLGLATTDPMSGFFALRREVFEEIRPRLRPRGFKALAEILFHAPSARVSDVPFEFGLRTAGESKLSQGVAFDYLWSLAELPLRRSLASRFVRYCLVGLSGVVVQLGALALLRRLLDSESVALALAILTAMVSNFVLNNLWTFEDRRLESWAFGGGLMTFIAISTVGAVLNHLTTMQFHRASGIDLLWSSLTGIAVATIWNYTLNLGITWRGPR